MSLSPEEGIENSVHGMEWKGFRIKESYSNTNYKQDTYEFILVLSWEDVHELSKLAKSIEKQINRLDKGSQA